MNKAIVFVMCIIAIIFAIFLGIQVFKIQNEKDNIEYNVQLSEAIEDECTEEWKELNSENVLNLQVSTQENVTLSPNCSFTFQTHYLGCGHTSKKYINIPQQLVNKTKEELQELYQDYKITKFTANDVILEKETEGECGEHYVLRDVDGKVVIYVIKNDKEEEYERTEISTDYLTETDKIAMKNGLKVFGKEELNQAIEDFE